MRQKLTVYEVGKEPFGVFVVVATLDDAERVVQEDIAYEKENGNFDYTEDDYFINPVKVFSYGTKKGE